MEKETPVKATKPSAWRLVAIICVGIVLFLYGLTVPHGGRSGLLDAAPFVLGLAFIGIGVVYLLTPEIETPPVKELRQLNVDDFIVYTIRLPKYTAWQPEKALQFITQFLNSFQSVIFRIVATHDAISWQMIDTQRYVIDNAMEIAIRASYPDVQITKQPFAVSSQAKSSIYRRVLYYKSAAEVAFSPIVYITDLKQIDPLMSITQTMSQLRPGEEIIYSLIVDIFDQDAYVRGQREITVKDFSRRWQGVEGLLTGKNVADHVVNIVSAPDELERFQSDLQRILRAKLETPLYRCYFIIEIDSPQPERLNDFAVIASQTYSFKRDRFNAPIVADDGIKDHQIQNELENLKTSAVGFYLDILNRNDKSPHSIEEKLRFTLNPDEIAALWHMPYTAMTASTIQWLSKYVEMPAALINQTTGTVLGLGRYMGKQRAVRIQPADRAAHQLVLGRINVGKSTYLHHLIRQDLQAGYGVCVIDPHGNLIRDILRCSIPLGREKDVVVLDFADINHPPGFNLLSATRDEDRSLTTASRVTEMIELMYGDLRDTPRTRETLESVIATLWLDENATLFDVPKVFDDKAYRDQLLQQGASRGLRQFWDSYNRMGKRLQYELRQPVEHRIRSLYSTPALEAIMGHPKSVDLQRLIAEDKIILISLDVDDKIIPKRGKELLGAIVVSAFEMGAIKRSSDKPFYVYIDEAHRFVTSSLSDLFVEVRKRGIVLTLATQYLKQLKGKTLEAIEGTVGTIVSFSIGDDDAKELPMMRPQFDPADLVKLDRFETAIWMKHEGVTMPAFSMRTISPDFECDQSAALNREKTLRTQSQESYSSLSRDDIFKWIDNRYSVGDDNDEDNDLLDPNPDDPEGDDDN